MGGGCEMVSKTKETKGKKLNDIWWGYCLLSSSFGGVSGDKPTR